MTSKDKLTFAELDELIPIFMQEMNELEENFKRQTEGVENFTPSINNNIQKLKDLHTRYNMAFCTQNALDYELQYIRLREEALEKVLDVLEAKFIAIPYQSTYDIQRENICRNLFTIYCTMNNLQELAVELAQCLNVSNCAVIKEPAEDVAQIMINQLKHLEYIERKCMTLKDQLSHLDHLKALALHKFKLKEDNVRQR